MPRRAELSWLHGELRVTGGVVLDRGEERVYVRVTVVRRPRAIGTPRSTGEFLSRYLSATWTRTQKRSLLGPFVGPRALPGRTGNKKCQVMHYVGRTGFEPVTSSVSECRSGPSGAVLPSL